MSTAWLTVASCRASDDNGLPPINYMSNTLGGSLGETYRLPQGRITIED